METGIKLLPDLELAEVLQELSNVSENEKYNLIELLGRTTFNERQIRDLERQINHCDTAEQMKTIAENIIRNLIQDKDRIAMGFSYNAGDIKKTLNNLK